MTSRPFTAAPILAVLAIVLVTLGAYAGGYFWLAKYDEVEQHRLKEETWDTIVIRRYRSTWQVSLFKPAGLIEQRLRGEEVWVMHDWHSSP